MVLCRMMVCVLLAVCPLGNIDKVSSLYRRYVSQSLTLMACHAKELARNGEQEGGADMLGWGEMQCRVKGQDGV